MPSTYPSLSLLSARKKHGIGGVNINNNFLYSFLFSIKKFLFPVLQYPPGTISYRQQAITGSDPPI